MGLPPLVLVGMMKTSPPACPGGRGMLLPSPAILRVVVPSLTQTERLRSVSWARKQTSPLLLTTGGTTSMPMGEPAVPGAMLPSPWIAMRVIVPVALL